MSTEAPRPTGLRSLLAGMFKFGSASTLGLGAMFLTHLLIGRLLGAEGYGRFSSALAIALLFIPLLDPGHYYLMIREIARDVGSTSRYLSHTLTWRLMVSPVYFALCLGVAFVVHDSPGTLAVAAILTISVVLQITAEATRPALLGNEKFGIAGVPWAAGAFGLLLASAVATFYGVGLIAVAWMFLAVRAAELMLSIAIFSRALGPVSLGFDFSFIRSMLIKALPIGAYYITLTIYNYIDIIMLSVLRNDTEVGWYSASYKLYEGPVFLPAIIGSVFMPQLSKAYVNDIKVYIHTLETGLKYIFLAAVFIVVNAILFADLIVFITYGAEFKQSAVSLRILFSGLLFIFFLNFLQTALISIDRQKVLIVLALIGLVSNVALNALLIPRYGYLGAAAATVAIEGAICLALCIYVHRSFKLTPLWWWLARWCFILIGAGVAVISIWPDASIYLQAALLNAVLLIMLAVELFRPGGLIHDLRHSA